MQLLTEDALIVCAHVLGTVGLSPRQNLVSIAHRPAVSTYHDRHLVLDRLPDGRARLRQAEEAVVHT